MHGIIAPEHLQDLMRISMNGPNDLENFPATACWVQKHLKVDDPSRVKKESSSMIYYKDTQKIVLLQSSYFTLLSNP